MSSLSWISCSQFIGIAAGSVVISYGLSWAFSQNFQYKRYKSNYHYFTKHYLATQKTPSVEIQAFDIDKGKTVCVQGTVCGDCGFIDVEKELDTHEVSYALTEIFGRSTMGFTWTSSTKN